MKIDQKFVVFWNIQANYLSDVD